MFLPEWRNRHEADTRRHTVTRADPPLKGTHFRAERKQESVRQSEVHRQRGPWEAQAHTERAVPSKEWAAVSCVTDLRRLTYSHYKNTKVKHAPRNSRLNPYPQRGRTGDTDIDSSFIWRGKPPPYLHRDSDTWRQAIKDNISAFEQEQIIKKKSRTKQMSWVGLILLGNALYVHIQHL